jgi:hypothetical protein
MSVESYTIANLMEVARYLSADHFVEQYPGCYLLAMGLLSTEEILASSPAGFGSTMPVRFGQNPRHALGSFHPLAGYAFHFRPRSKEVMLMLGRSRYCDVLVPEDTISEEHCRLLIRGEQMAVIDIGSTNGTSVNLTRLERGDPRRLVDGDMVTIGRYSFQFLSARSLHLTLAAINALSEGADRR